MGGHPTLLTRLIRPTIDSSLLKTIESAVQRSIIAYYGFPILARIMFWHRFIREDGQISVARSFVRADWESYLHKAGITPEQAEITWYFPFRLCVASR